MKVDEKIEHRGYMRTSQVLQLYPVSKTQWWNMVKENKTPRPIKMGTRSTAFKTSEVMEFLNKLEE